MLENCDALLNATVVYQQNHYCATRSALGKVSESTSTWPHDQQQTQEVRGSHRESVLTQQPPPTLRVADSGASENLAIWRIWRLIWHRLDKDSINYVAHRYLRGGKKHNWETNGYFTWDIHYFACSLTTQEGIFASPNVGFSIGLMWY